MKPSLLNNNNNNNNQFDFSLSKRASCLTKH
jgi:hypothetical protein